MPRVFIPTQLRDATAGLAQIDLPGSSVREVLAALAERFPAAQARLCVGDELLPGLQVSVDHIATRSLSLPVAPTSEIHFLPAIGGG